ncbi:TIGR02996 domain-containing protein [Frigoriglobus tundricola]|uniref:TIGR02996 domain-containing protein n=1 Tax=Frigoriglobus tundricola TaxID=2774151 RepID=A0A6M5YYF5_9BACT|nr:TIGR02996 domain-containing protein [Frigoriglobus tundricola]QJW98898.1 hypothetical protein FTUN_6493 [Frigoriglobus tundricola]
MQTEAKAFLQRIRAYPDDDAQRLIFADWLDEEGDPRGRFIRVQLALAELPPDAAARKVLAVVERDLLEAHREEWEAPLRRLASGCVFRRGFVDEINVGAKLFLRNADEIFEAAPVRHVHLLDVSEGLPDVLQCPYLSRLAALTIHASHTGEPLARAVARSEHLSGLRRLTLTRNRFADDAAEQLALSPNLANLEELDLSENEIGETGARALAASASLGKLRRLELRNNPLGPAGAEAVAGSDRLTALHRLGLSGCDVGLPRLLSLGRAHDLLRVPVLDLSGNDLTAYGLQAIIGHLPAGVSSEVRLTELDLSANETLGNAGAKMLADCPYLENLTVLRLANCGISDDGARALANGRHLERVTTLDLSTNPIDSNGFREFLNTRYWRSLRRLIPPRGISAQIYELLDRKFNRPARRG